MNIEAHLIKNNVVINDKLIKSNDKFDPLKQVDLIVQIHQILGCKNNTIIPRINSTIGKELESFKIQVRKINNNIKLIERNKESDDVDIYFRDIAISIVKTAMLCIECIEGRDYLNLIRRSMENYELCLGRVDENNLAIQEDGAINIKTTKYISYNLLEQDIFKYIKRVRRREIAINTDDVIDRFVLKSELGQESKFYLKTLDIYPLESMKILSKYKSLKYDNFVERVEGAKQIDYRE